jgi:hypothetical protein
MVDANKKGRCVFCLGKKRITIQNIGAKPVESTFKKLSRKAHLYHVLKNGILDRI